MKTARVLKCFAKRFIKFGETNIGLMKWAKNWTPENIWDWVKEIRKQEHQEIKALIDETFDKKLKQYNDMMKDSEFEKPQFDRISAMRTAIAGMKSELKEKL